MSAVTFARPSLSSLVSALAVSVFVFGCGGGGGTPEERLQTAEDQFDEVNEASGYESLAKDLESLKSDLGAEADASIRFKTDFLLARCKARSGDKAGSEAGFGGLSADHKDRFKAEYYFMLGMDLADGNLLDVALNLIKEATDRFPDRKDTFAKLADHMKEKGGAEMADALKAIGYF